MSFDIENGNNTPKKRSSLVFESDKKRSLFRSTDKSPPIGILAFETAKTMSRLLCLHKSLSDEEVSKLRKETVKLEGISFLISRDEDYLLKLACMEKAEELDHAGAVVARLGKNCFNPDLINFDRIFNDMKLGIIDLSHFSSAKQVEKTMEKLEKYVATTSELYSCLEALTEMEMSERKLKQWKFSGPMPLLVKSNDISKKTNYDYFDSKIAWQRQQVRHLRQISLWGQTFNKTVRLMARGVCIVYARLSITFSPYMIKPSRHIRISSHPDMQSYHINRLERGGGGLSRSSQVRGNSSEKNIGTGGSALMRQAKQSTAGAAGLALRYAKVILVADRFLQTWSFIDESGREELFQMLPRNLRRLVKSKLRKITVEESRDESLAEGWREGLKRILGWLAPMANDTLKWQMERNVEKQDFDPRPKVLLLQTLFFADREKSEAAIAEVLVGLSCICKYELRNPEVSE
ncbi:hypothetical protein ACHQM5_010317 [Ranunculus cassubicifolius]